MRFFTPLAMLAVAASAMPFSDNAIGAPVDNELAKRDQGQYRFVFNTQLRGAVRDVQGVALSITYNALTQSIVAYVVDFSSGGNDVSAQPIDAGKEYSWYVGHNLVDTGDQGKFEWRTNY
ncbi:hypothetical protein BDZ85DRAFT_281843 [Elsinoe ampelina]|uniref:Uncharacterized protein n=1 Tax=Elsinoe ampelina TaxID=302913 RepID=A0A6A6GAP6_9PEZI|nr:hypothetical protein BDZ85DRAFT_281843 [Elsinoe ampelina]